MSRGTTIDKLYVSIGLDADDLKVGFEKTDKTVNQELAKLNAESKKIRLKADVDLTKLSNAGTELDRLKVKAKALQDELALALKKQNITQQIEDAFKNKYGANHVLTNKASMNNLYSAKNIAELENKLRNVNNEISKISPKSTAAFSKMHMGAMKAKTSVNSLTNNFNILNAKYASFLAVVGTGAGLFSLTESAMKAGESIYRLQNRLHTTTAEASALNKVFSLSGVDANLLPSFLVRLDKSYMATGKSGEEARQKLEAFGVSLTDENGNLLSTTEQLEQLALGFENAKKNGDEEAFSMEVLGARGQALIPVLDQFAEKLNMAKNTKSTGLLDPKQAHEAYLEYQQLQMELGQLKSAVGASLLPLAKEVLPDVIKSTGDFVDVIKNNKDGIKDAMSGWADALKTVGSAALTATEAVGKLINAVTNSDLSKALKNDEKILENARKQQQIARGKSYAETAGLVIGGIGGGVLGGGVGAGAGALIGHELAGDFYTEIGKLFTDDKTWNYTKQKLDLKEQEKKALEDFTKAQAENTQQSKENASAQKEAATALKVREEATKALKEEIEELTSSDFDNQVRALNKKIKDAKAKGVDDGTLSDFFNAKMKKITDSVNDSVFRPMSQAFKTDLQNALDDVDEQAKKYKETAGSALSDKKLNAWINQRKAQIRSDWDKQVAEQIDSIWNTEYENQLARIEREKQEWIKKGLDEVKATQHAEEQKKQLQENTAKAMFTSQAKYFKMYRSTLANGGTVNDAANAIGRAMRRDQGIPQDAFTTPQEIRGFQDAMKKAQDNLIPILGDNIASGTYKGTKQAMIEVMRSTNDSSYVFDNFNYNPTSIPTVAYNYQGIGRQIAKDFIEVIKGTTSERTAIHKTELDFSNFRVWTEQETEKLRSEQGKDNQALIENTNAIMRINNDLNEQNRQVAEYVKTGLEPTRNELYELGHHISEANELSGKEVQELEKANAIGNQNVSTDALNQLNDMTDKVLKNQSEVLSNLSSRFSDSLNNNTDRTVKAVETLVKAKEHEKPNTVNNVHVNFDHTMTIDDYSRRLVANDVLDVVTKQVGIANNRIR